MALKLQLLLDAVCFCFFCFFLGGGGGGGAGELGLQTQTSLFPSMTSVVFLNYGTNDLAANVPPLQAAVKVFEPN